MTTGLYKKGLVLGIICLFIGTGLASSTTVNLGPTSESSFIGVIEEKLTTPDYQNNISKVDITSGLVGYWSFDDGSVTDYSGMNHHGTKIGTTYHPFGGPDDSGCLEFDGVNDYVSIPDHSDWTFGDDPFTVSVWVNFIEVVPRAPFVDHNEDPEEYNKWVFWYDDSGHDTPYGPAIRFHINSPTFPPMDTVYAPWEPNTEQWYHIAVTRTSGNYVLYIDADQVATGINLFTIPDANVPLTIGQSENQYFFNGFIDEARVYNRSLNASDIWELFMYNGGNQSSLEIESINGFFRVSADIKNTGETTATNVEWSIDLEGGLILAGDHSDGVIDELAPGATKTIRQTTLYGIGMTTITVTVGDNTKQATAFILGPLVLGVN